MSLLNKLRKQFWKFDINIERFSSSTNHLSRRKRILNYYDIDTVFDIGANEGQYAKQLRDLNYKNRIISFEPLISTFTILKKNSKSDLKWDVFNYGLGSEEGSMKINISENSYSSSLLEILPKHIDAAPSSRYINHELVTIKTMDSVFNNFCDQTNSVYVKIDTQGFEKEVLKGSTNSLSNINIIQLEMSLTPLYKNESLFHEMFDFLTSNNYKMIGFESGFIDYKSGELLQIDGLFKRI